MAGFNPHVGTSHGGYTALPAVQVSAVLDTLVSDLGAGINGWSLFDDVRVNGSSYPILIPIYTGLGVLDTFYISANSWNFTNGQPTVVSYIPYGRHFGYSISGVSASQTPITIDGGANYYNAYYTSAAGSNSTATLDRNFAGSTVGVRDIFTKLIRYVIFKQSSANKNFFVLIGQRTDTYGTPNIYIQPFEDWNAGTHVGTNGGPIEAHRFYWEGTVNASASCRYVSWFLADAFALWTGGEVGWSATAQENFSIISSLDTYGMRSGDSDALCYIASDTTTSGYCCPGAAGAVVGQAAGPLPLGGIQCLRTLQGETWSMPSTYGSNWNPKNSYQIYPRGRPYTMNVITPLIDMSGRFEITDIDLWHVGYTQQTSFIGMMSANEGRRGKLRYVKLPCGNPAWMHLGTLGPAEDGNVYVFLRISPAFKAIPGGQTTVVTREVNSNNFVQGVATGWAHSNLIYNDYLGDWFPCATAATMQYTYLLMPIS